jgi:hypothetical protein
VLHLSPRSVVLREHVSKVNKSILIFDNAGEASLASFSPSTLAQMPVLAALDALVVEDLLRAYSDS